MAVYLGVTDFTSVSAMMDFFPEAEERSESGSNGSSEDVKESDSEDKEELNTFASLNSSWKFHISKLGKNKFDHLKVPSWFSLSIWKPPQIV